MTGIRFSDGVIFLLPTQCSSLLIEISSPLPQTPAPRISLPLGSGLFLPCSLGTRHAAVQAAHDPTRVSHQPPPLNLAVNALACLGLPWPALPCLALRSLRLCVKTCLGLLGLAAGGPGGTPQRKVDREALDPRLRGDDGGREAEVFCRSCPTLLCLAFAPPRLRVKMP